jgi:hypothetical protein
MAFAVWRILRIPRESSLRDRALLLFYLQLALNAAWSWMFFGTHSPLLGLINIVPQFVVILFTLALFRRLDRIAAWCLLPLALWVGFASVLNCSIWWLNSWDACGHAAHGIISEQASVPNVVGLWDNDVEEPDEDSYFGGNHRRHGRHSDRIITAVFKRRARRS